MPQSDDTPFEPDSDNPDYDRDHAATATAVETQPAPPVVDRMPQWRVLLHNDDINDMLFVAQAILELTSLNRRDAFLRMIDAHQRGIALLLMTHREHAELLQEQFASKTLIVTIEPG